MSGATPPAGLLDCVLASINLGAVVLDGSHRVVLWNDWMGRHAGRPADGVLGRDLFELYPALRGQRVHSAVEQALCNGFRSLLSQSLNKSPFPLYADAAAAARGERLQQAVEVTPLTVADAGRHCLIQISDVSIAVARERLLREQAMVLRSQTFADGLTGIANRRHFDVTMEKEQRRAKRGGSALSLLMIDIDNFKSYNDHYGHQQGDLCLIQVAAALAAVLKRPCDLMARYGGEEFAMILPDTDAAQAMLMAESIRQRTIELAIAHVPGMHKEPCITVSIGIATQRPGAALDAAALIGAADRALYLAKRSGRNRVESQPPV
ncbi:diguanylate cyclase [Rugamonas sp. CCM 8940]|uniref:sensor domain-containing diguanylate cyclase n=1 Tax=Rugamonas sp. CCM 8940 TaxID=2765359 RepID=UPI0018F3B051|nr:sensor domain-containing diguanylate cyclase [Rugamonas sp. CCM 8940]MBJ7311047.1 diguanylate cyclase [Rugamonas sp. CCM 8940]